MDRSQHFRFGNRFTAANDFTIIGILRCQFLLLVMTLFTEADWALADRVEIRLLLLFFLFLDQSDYLPGNGCRGSQTGRFNPNQIDCVRRFLTAFDDKVVKTTFGFADEFGANTAEVADKVF